MVCQRTCEKCKVNTEEDGRAIGRYRFQRDDGTDWWLCTDCAKEVAAKRMAARRKGQAKSTAMSSSEHALFMSTHWECQGLGKDPTQAIGTKYKRRLAAIGATYEQALDATMELEPAGYNTPAISLKGLVVLVLARRHRAVQQAEDEPLDQRQRNWSARCMRAIGTAMNTKRPADFVKMRELSIKYSESDLEHGVGDPERIRKGIEALKRRIPHARQATDAEAVGSVQAVGRAEVAEAPGASTGRPQ